LVINTNILSKPNSQTSEQHSTTSEAINLTQLSQNQQSQSSYASILQSNNNNSSSNHSKLQTTSENKLSTLENNSSILPT
ncbi:26056_t:CDS:2, partial [Gigaspora margarita]